MSDEEARAFGDSVKDWPVFPDTPEALAYLKRHYKLVIVSNVDRASFARSDAGLGVTFDASSPLTTPAPTSRPTTTSQLALAAGRDGSPSDRVLHVAQSLYHDHVPAQQLGLRTMWVNRRLPRPGKAAPRRPLRSR